MNAPVIIRKIEETLKLKLKPIEIDLSEAKEDESKFIQKKVLDFMRYGVKDNPECQYKYLIHQGQIIGLCLRSTPSLKIFPFLQDTELQGLRALNLTENSLEELELPATLQALQYLDISDNKALQALTFEKGLAALKVLDASDSGLGAVYFPTGFDSLEKIDISRNRLESCTFSEGLNMLKSLDLSKNKLTNLHLPIGFERLRFLYLANNSLKEVHFPTHLAQLTTLNIRANQLYSDELPLDFLNYFPVLESLYINENPLPDALRLMVEERRRKNQLGDVENYLLEMAKGTKKDNEVKVLVLGNGSVGKTCFVQRLVHDTKLKKWNSTHAINLEEYAYQSYLLNLWDFGGQDIYFATHRLFMQSNSIYLVLWDLTTETKEVTPIEENGETIEYNNYRLPYWLDYAKIQGWDKRKATHSPLIIVETKVNPQKGNIPPHFNQKDWQDIFPYFHASIAIDSLAENKEDTGFDEVLFHIGRAVRTMGMHTAIPETYWQLRKAIREKQQLKGMERQKRMSLQEYLELAIDLEDPMSVLEHWLTKTGVVFYRKGMFKDQIILDQKWAIDAVYALFRRIPPDKQQHREQFYVYKDWLSKSGRFSGADLAEIWNGEYAENEQRLFVDFMLSCKMCFEIGQKEKDRHSYPPFNERKFIAPQLLPFDRPDIVAKQEELWQNTPNNLLYFKYTHVFLHYGIIQNFIFDTHHLAETSKSIWRNGILIRYKGINALVEIKCKEQLHQHLYHEIWVKVDKEAKDLLDIIRNILEELLGLGFKEWGSRDGQEWKDLALLKKDFADYALPIRQRYAVFFDKDDKANFVANTEQQEIHFNHKINAMEEVQRLVAANKLEKAISVLLTAAENALENELIQLQSRLNSLKRENRMGIISNDNYNLEINKIRYAILEATNEVQVITTKEITIHSNRGVIKRTKLPRPTKPIIEVNMAENAKTAEFLKDAKETIKLLFLAASPMNQGQINTGSESRFKDLIKEFDENKRIRFREEHGLTSQKFQNILFTDDPHIIHYGGHGFREGIFLEDKALDVDLLVGLLEDAENAQVVVLNACNTLEIAKKVAQYVPYVIATCDVIEDAVAIAFAKGFYVGIAAGKTIEKSFKHGVRIAESEKLDNTDVLVLVKGIKA